ncbi:LysR family transcriptional regulator [Pelagivirga sediminicola]|uniref:LysR family transcriptional regulator n=1 Tax=Pelagivirga sediminicola TaxID=2170575 RepID=A0A2T7G893_9RHOB|nr:LysR family transcriptional regulator [Pelagivirga sediminicola]PVA10607.1 LysR family transcriptional regulator [Pelagivirga sediminicola]
MDSLDPRFLREFLCVAQEGSIRRAATRLNIAPSAISRKITDIEARLGAPLLERSAQGVALTGAGRLMQEHALHLQDEQTFLLDQLGRYGDGAGHAVRIAVGEGFTADLMQNGLAPLARAHPDLRYRIDQAGTGALQDRVVLGEADIGIAYNPAPSEAIRSLALGRQPLCAIVPAGSPLAARASVRLREVLEQPLALLDARHAIRTLVGRAAGDQGLALRPQIETSSITLLIRYVCAGMGATFLPRFSVSIQAARGELAIVPVQEASLQQVSAHLMVRARRRLPKSVELAATFLAQNMIAFRD